MEEIISTSDTKTSNEVIKSLIDIKTLNDFSNNIEYKTYLVNNYRLLVNKLNSLAIEVKEFEKIRKNILESINTSSEDSNNNDVMINVNTIDNTVETEEEEDKPKAKKTTKKVEELEEEDKPKAKKTTKKVEELEEEDKPKAKKTTKKVKESEEKEEDKTKAKKTTKKVEESEEKPKAKKTTKKTEKTEESEVIEEK